MLLKKQKSWTTRPYEDGDEEKIIKLFEDVFGKPMGISESQKHWNWEFKENPVDNKYINLAVDGDEIVGQYAVLPLRMWINGKEKLGSLSLDTMVHPDYRGQGMFTTMAEELYDILAEDGVVLTYGFPNENSIHGFTKYLDWKEIFKIPLYARPIDFDKSAKMMFGEGVKKSLASFFSKKIYDVRHTPKKVSSPYHIEKIRSFSPEFDELSKVSDGISVIRDSEYLNWRFTDKPEFDYTKISITKDGNLEGYAVLFVKEYSDNDIGFIVDMNTKHRNNETAELLLSECVRRADRLDCDILSYITPNDGRYSKALKRYGFLKVDPEKFPQDIFFGVRSNAGESPLIFNEEKWYISWADTDLV